MAYRPRNAVATVGGMGDQISVEQPQDEVSAAGKTGPRYSVGTVLQSRSTAISKLELGVREKLVAEGFKVHKGRSAIQCGYEPRRGNYPILTPDILISKEKVCIEVDSGYTHRGEEEKDRTRNRLLAEAGWTVVRLRLGGLEPIGPYDVVAESSADTKQSIEALVEAVKDAVASRPGKVRRVEKKPAAPKKKSRLGAIAEHKYYDNAYYVSWTLESGQKHQMIAAAGGRYLAQADGWGFPRFIRNLGLHEVPRAQWRKVLEPVLEAMDEADFAPVSVFPWGDSFFIGDQADKIALPSKFNPGGPGCSLTSNLDGVHAYTDSAIADEAGSVLVEIHPDAVEMGWKIAVVELRTGYRGDYQAIGLVRDTGTPVGS